MIFNALVYLLTIFTSIYAELEPYTLDEFFDGTFKDKGWNGTWVSDSVFIAKNVFNDYYKVDVTTQSVELLIKAGDLRKFKKSYVTCVNDCNYILIRHNTKAIFRHSTASQYTVYDIENKKRYDIHNKKHLQLVRWIPNNNGLVYVFDNNIYYAPTLADISQPKQITKDGDRGMVFNGIPDWVYEEEVLSSGSALWLSPSGKRLAFATFDDRDVMDYHYFIYGQPGNLSSQYPSIVSLKYPKAGTPNPIVSLKYVNLDDPVLKVTDLDIIPVDIVSSDHILSDVTWANNETVVATSLNRVQNIAVVVKCNVEIPICYKMYRSQQSKGWLDTETPKFLDNGERSIILSPESEGNDFFNHLSIVNGNDVTGRKRLTYGRRVVLSIYGIDEKKNFVYYLATVPNKSYQEHVYGFDYKNNVEYCVTCIFVVPEGLCGVSSAVFSKQFSYVTKICNGPGPRIVQIQNLKNGKYFTWEANDALHKTLARKLKPIVKTIQVPLKNNLYATVRLLLPPELNESFGKKYPLIVNVYAGPNSNRIVDRYSSGVENYFVTKRNYIYAYIDARGSGKQGNRMLFEVYRRLGTVEIDDQVEITKFLLSKYQFIDENNVGIWGWSYGGFATLQALIKDTENIFKVGVAVAPVTSFLYYDSIYTERYMGLPSPDDNIEGYKNADVLTQIEGLRNKTFYLIHGNADDNVHYQQSMLLAKMLERADIMFYQQSYPDENHGLLRVRRHLYHTIDDFFYRSFHQHKKITLKNRKKLRSRSIKIRSE